MPAFDSEAVPLVTAVPRPVHPAAQSTSTAASAPPPASAPLRAAHAPPETVQPALPLLVASAVMASAVVTRAAESLSAAPAVPVPASLVVPASWASPVVLAAPVQPASHRTSASATTVSPSSPRSTALEVRQPPLPSQRAAPPPSARTFSSVVLTARTSRSRESSSAAEPLLRLSQPPPAVSHDASAPSRSAAVLTPHVPLHDADAAVLRSEPAEGAPVSLVGPLDPLRHEPPSDSQSALARSRVAVLDCSHPRAFPSHRADALVTSPPTPRLDALLPHPESSHDASAFDPPDEDDAPQLDTPDRHSRRSESRSPSADSLADPQPTNAPSESQPADAPSPSRSSSDTVRTSRSVASINSSVAS
ncbi:hypothetical protein [Pseudonocardia hierapolitana]|uniref:hypothetical protein n=1 Tax=Pseudonocardia hierapolitana TaxID=1128676 RepID=UPI0011BEA243|nr:hypothetical protein [Pseudonocardia hierapolitana]